MSQLSMEIMKVTFIVATETIWSSLQEEQSWGHHNCRVQMVILFSTSNVRRLGSLSPVAPAMLKELTSVMYSVWEEIDHLLKKKKKKEKKKTGMECFKDVWPKS